MKVTPLYYAFTQRNNRSVKLLLQYMGELDYNALYSIKAILPDLIDYSGFKEYLEGLPFQSIQMQTKQTLRVQSKDLEDIVKIKPSITSYVDREYYIDVMEEQKDKDMDDHNYKNYPVKVQALRANWILDSDGKRFFK